MNRIKKGALVFAGLLIGLCLLPLPTKAITPPPRIKYDF